MSSNQDEVLARYRAAAKAMAEAAELDRALRGQDQKCQPSNVIDLFGKREATL